MENSSNQYTNTKNLIHLYLLPKKFKHQNTESKDSKKEANEIYFIQKKILDKYKELCHYKELIDFFESNENILNNITKTKLNETEIMNIINQIPGYKIDKIEYMKEENLLNELTQENNNQWKYKSLKIGNKSINYIDDFEMIDEHLNKFFKEKNFKVLKGKCIIGIEGIFIYIPYGKESFFEIGKFDGNGNFIIEYLFDQKNIGNSTNFIKALIDEGTNSILNKIISKETEKKDKIIINRALHNLYIFNDKNIETNLNNIILPSLNESIINNSIVSTDTNSKTKKNQENKSSPKPIGLKDKLECLIILSIYQKIIKKTNTKAQKVFLLSKIYLDQFLFDEVEELVNRNAKIKKIINNKNINELSLDLIDKSFLKDKEFKEIKKEISNIKIEKKFFPICKGKDFSLSKEKKIKVFKRFVLINEDLSKDMEAHFGIKFEKQYIRYRSIKEKDLLTVNDNDNDNDHQYTIFIGNINFEDHEYNIDYILNFETYDNLKEEFKVIINKKECNNYINDKLIYNKKNRKKEDNFPIYSENESLGIIGYGYKYKQNIDYTKYLNNEKLTNILSLFIYYENIKNKKSEKFEKYYLINSKIVNNIKIENDYKLLSDYLNENIKKIKTMDDNKKNVYSLLKTLQNDILDNYSSNNKFNKIKNKSQFNTSVEPIIISINYFDDQNGNFDSFFIYSDFEIIGKEMIESLIGKYENKNIFCECFFEKGKIIIKMPKNLNKKIICLIGSLHNYYHNFIIEFILIYDKDKNREKHFKEILGKFDKYLNNLQFHRNNAPITIGKNFEIIGTVIKYGKDYDNSINTDYSSNISIDTNSNISTDANNNKKNIKKNNQDNKKKTLKENFKSCPHIGLQNIGATCYMNSTLQCFCHIENFVEFFKYKIALKNKKDKLSSSFKILIDNLWPVNFNPSSPDSKKYYSPEEFKNKISKLNPLFEGIAANDAKDLVNFIIMTLHLELNKITKIKETQINGIIDQTNKEEIKNIFKEDFDKRNNSIISKLFYATNYNTTQCCNCKSYIYNFQTYFFINFPLEEVRKYKIEIMNNQQNYINNIQNNFFINPFSNYNMLQQNQFMMMNQQMLMNNNINEVNILECFDYDKKVNYMTGENQMFCNQCRQNSDSYMATNLYTGPEVLILILNRGKGIEFNVKIYFTEELDLSKYIENKESGYMYKLIGVITHLGESSMSGHFIAYCKDPLDGKWFKYNDAIVDEVKNFKKEVIDFAMPYLLFYEKIKNS